ncbi:hypothetical protein GCM10022289_18430 [Pedobacter jeongneungensis]|uniref:Uncharacterized protein n=1 Tax=Pedobacter jeongneungensis TaxID=947309 RepID=A0ABP8BBJ6_9SPHI
MSHNLKKFLLKSVIVLALIHLAYFIYGYFKFAGIGKINIYTEFYRFKFYDDVSISHFFVTGIFLLTILILLIRNYSRQQYNIPNLIKIGAVLLPVVFLSLTFFISYSFGLNAKLRQELPEKNFNADKRLLNVLNPFLYPGSAYNSETLFNVTNILYPKPYPVIKVMDTVFYDPADKESFSLQSAYYSIDTLKMLTSGYEKLKSATNTADELFGFDQKELQKRIITKTLRKDSTEIIFKGAEVNPQYDDSICIFLENKTLISPVNDESVAKQQRQNAIDRYKLLYKLNKDSLLQSFKKLDTLLKKYNIESSVNPVALNQDVFRFRDKDQDQLDQMRNNFDRNALTEKINTLNRLFYQPGYFHSSIREIFFIVLFSTWLFGFVIFVISTYIRKPKQSMPEPIS